MPAPTNPNMGQLDATQILQRGFDEATDKFRVDSSVSVTSITGDVTVELSAADGDSVIVSDGVDNLAINADGTIDVKNITGTVSLPTGASTTALQTTGNTSLSSIDSKLTSPLTINLPTGASTAANQTTANTSLASIDSKTPTLVSGRQPVDGSAVTQPISAASLPLPTGAATAANQVTANTSLASIDAGIPVALGQTTMAASMPVVIALDQDPIQDIETSGSISGNGIIVTINTEGRNTLTTTLTGTWSSLITVSGSADGITYVIIQMYNIIGGMLSQLQQETECILPLAQDYNLLGLVLRFIHLEQLVLQLDHQLLIV